VSTGNTSRAIGRAKPAVIAAAAQKRSTSEKPELSPMESAGKKPARHAPEPAGNQDLERKQEGASSPVSGSDPVPPRAARTQVSEPQEEMTESSERARADGDQAAAASPGLEEPEDADGQLPPEAPATRQPPPRPPAKPEVFREGDHVVYPTHGVGKVERIAVEEIAGHKLELIHITFEENRMTLRVPVAKARSAGLRKLATRKMFDEAMAVLKGKARIKRTMWSRRAQEYEAKINSGDPIAIAEVVRDLHRNAGQPDQSFSERQIYEAAMDRLAAELAALDRTDKATAATKLAEFLKTV
jgi:CarD family transcriptional regulator, regulator of rRNA transcription